jgi:hypothetical protein
MAAPITRTFAINQSDWRTAIITPQSGNAEHAPNREIGDGPAPACR